MADYVRKVDFDKAAVQWARCTTLSHVFKRNLRHVFCELDFGGRVEGAPLLDAVAFL